MKAEASLILREKRQTYYYIVFGARIPPRKKQPSHQYSCLIFLFFFNPGQSISFQIWDKIYVYFKYPGRGNSGPSNHSKLKRTVEGEEEKNGRMLGANRDRKEKMWHPSQTRFTHHKHHKESYSIQQPFLKCQGLS